MKRGRSPAAVRDRAAGLHVLPFAFGGGRFAVLVEELDAGVLPDTITVAEREVGLLVRRGFSNLEIALGRGTSERTVANQISSLMRKVGAGSRVQLALRLGAVPVPLPAK